MGDTVKEPLLRTEVRDAGGFVTLQVNGPTASHQEVVPCRISVESLSYYLGSGEKEAQILHSVTTAFSPGTLTAVMGPSGAGKTTLLNVLVGNAAGRIDGGVLVNGRPLKEVASRFKRLYTFVPQDDTLLASLTPRESLKYAAKLRLPRSLPWSEKAALIEEVLRELSLTGVADQRIGDVDRRGLSGGQKKRVSIALELLTNPSVMFVDEPTSGLDSKMAEDVVVTLRRLASQGRTLICTIHQPSYKIFSKFDRLVLLNKGGIAYDGPVLSVEAYFQSLGHVTPRAENPIDHYMALLQSPEGAGLVGVWDEKRDEYCQSGVVLPSGKQQPHLPDLRFLSMPYTVPRWYQTLVLFQRGMLDAVKDKEKFGNGLVLKLAVGVVVGVVWLNQAGTTNKAIFPTTGALFIATTSSVLDTLFATVLALPSSKALLLREYKNGYYSMLPAYVSMLLCHVLLNIFFAIFLGTPIYLLLGVPRQAQTYFLFLSILAELATIGAALGLAVGSLVKDLPSAQQAVMPTVIPLLLFSSFLLPYDTIPAYFRFLYWASPFAYAFKALQIVLFKDMVFTDCQPNYSCLGCMMQSCAAACADVPTGPPCFQTGVEYLRSVNTDPDGLGFCFGILAAVFAVLFVLGGISMKVLISKKTN